ncbi:helix-turn-helix domain-containing protein [Canibacter sp. lx-72]|nr:helix-turn-helix domain-containing protein [Canibacter zhuwentaonis]
MHLTYNPLWKLLIDRGMNKEDLRELTGLSASTIAKLGKGETVRTDVLLRICEALNCDLVDIAKCETYDKVTSASERTKTDG